MWKKKKKILWARIVISFHVVVRQQLSGGKINLFERVVGQIQLTGSVKGPKKIFFYIFPTFISIGHRLSGINCTIVNFRLLLAPHCC